MLLSRTRHDKKRKKIKKKNTSFVPISWSVIFQSIETEKLSVKFTLVVGFRLFVFVFFFQWRLDYTSLTHTIIIHSNSSEKWSIYKKNNCARTYLFYKRSNPLYFHKRKISTWNHFCLYIPNWDNYSKRVHPRDKLIHTHDYTRGTYINSRIQIIFFE